MRVFTLLTLVLAGCEAPAIHTRNNEPSPTVVFPREGDALVEGEPTTLLGSVSDTNDHPEELVATWLAGDEVLCAEAPIAADGSSTCEGVFERGDLEISLSSRDPDGAEGVATVALTVQANDAPVVEIFAPAADGAYTNDGYVVFDGRVWDYEDAPSELVVAWTDETGAVLDVDDVVDTDGSLSGAARLDAGTHTITLSATDGPGLTGSASVTFEVDPG
jgi:hypothetical protein